MQTLLSFTNQHNSGLRNLHVQNQLSIVKVVKASFWISWKLDAEFLDPQNSSVWCTFTSIWTSLPCYCHQTLKAAVAPKANFTVLCFWLILISSEDENFVFANINGKLLLLRVMTKLQHPESAVGMHKIFMPVEMRQKMNGGIFEFKHSAESNELQIDNSCTRLCASVNVPIIHFIYARWAYSSKWCDGCAEIHF